MQSYFLFLFFIFFNLIHQEALMIIGELIWNVLPQEVENSITL